MFSIITPNGSIELAPGAGNCIARGCKMKGGNQLQLTVHSVDPEPETRRFNVCGKHFATAVAAVINPTPDPFARP